MIIGKAVYSRSWPAGYLTLERRYDDAFSTTRRLYFGRRRADDATFCRARRCSAEAADAARFTEVALDIGRHARQRE